MACGKSSIRDGAGRRRRSTRRSHCPARPTAASAASPRWAQPLGQPEMWITSPARSARQRLRDVGAKRAGGNFARTADRARPPQATTRRRESSGSVMKRAPGPPRTNGETLSGRRPTNRSARPGAGRAPMRTGRGRGVEQGFQRRPHRYDRTPGRRRRDVSGACLWVPTGSAAGRGGGRGASIHGSPRRRETPQCHRGATMSRARASGPCAAITLSSRPTVSPACVGAIAPIGTAVAGVAADRDIQADAVGRGRGAQPHVGAERIEMQSAAAVDDGGDLGG